jgi:hypothetical protein
MDGLPIASIVAKLLYESSHAALIGFSIAIQLASLPGGGTMTARSSAKLFTLAD